MLDRDDLAVTEVNLVQTVADQITSLFALRDQHIGPDQSVPGREDETDLRRHPRLLPGINAADLPADFLIFFRMHREQRGKYGSGQQQRFPHKRLL